MQESSHRTAYAPEKIENIRTRIPTVPHQDQENLQNFQNRVGDKFKMLLT